eukprot:m.29967 g.29967  ORF g.29967 m.29967 type:complete len:309 (-) comp11993_c0_seq2:983-1909(-)
MQTVLGAVKTLLQRRLITSLAVGSSTYCCYQAYSSTVMAAESTFNIAKYHSLLPSDTLGRVIEHRETVDTTMRWANEALTTQGSGAHGAVFLADEQTSGQGRRGRDWQSAAGGTNLYFSFVYAPATDTPAELLKEMQRLNFAIPLATAKTCHKVGATTAQIKWPNDVWINGKKVSGMLVNYNGRTGGVAGVGINVNQQFADTETLPAISLAQVTGKPVSREQVLATFFEQLTHLMAKSFAEVLQDYQEHDMLKGNVVRVYHQARGVDDERDFDAEVVGFQPDGSLLVVDPQGKQHELSGEEISIRPRS